MTCLILYGTTEGHTRKIATFMRDRLSAAGHVVTLVDAVEAPADLDPLRFDRVIVAASVHTGRYQAAVEDWVHRHAAALADAGAVFVSVSLSAAGHDEDDARALAQCTDEFERRTEWIPAEVHHAAGAFRYTQYDFFKQWALKYIAWRRGAPTDATQDYELTDWHALEQFADAVAAK
jgi:menaquinone-dependent protoporphyrinogen oxidase